jgi:hypothetical protein
MNNVLQNWAVLPVALACLAYYSARGWLRQARAWDRLAGCADLPPTLIERDGPRPAWYPPGPAWEDVRAERAERAGLLNCDEHDVMHPRETHCPKCYAEWSFIVSEGMAPAEPEWHESEIRAAGMWRCGR